MFGKGTAILALCAAAAFGCESADPGELSGPATGPRLNSAASEFVTTGGAEIAIVADILTERYSFVANREQDGSVVGQFEDQRNFVGQHSILHGDVICFTIVGNKARVGGIAKFRIPGISDSDPVEDVPIIWTVEDNGEGKNALEPDRASIMVTGVDPALHCGPVGADVGLLFPLETGNVQIHAKEP